MFQKCRKLELTVNRISLSQGERDMGEGPFVRARGSMYIVYTGIDGNGYFQPQIEREIREKINLISPAIVSPLNRSRGRTLNRGNQRIQSVGNGYKIYVFQHKQKITVSQYKTFSKVHRNSPLIQTIRL